MKKLHLVRPRRMRALRQNLGEANTGGTGTAVFVQCLGPSDSNKSVAGFLFSRFLANNKFAGINAPR